jgi:NADP-dependent 3-hydroxy acid dehydrogenase YdfG
MTLVDGKVALVTGASSGIGEAVALKLRSLGYTVYGAARRVERMAGLADRGVRTLAMDVTDGASMRAGVEQIVAAEGRIDVLVNNAGYGSYGAIEDVPLEEARAVRGQRVRRRAAGPARAAADARPARRHDRQHHLDGRQGALALGRLVPRHEVRPGGA